MITEIKTSIDRSSADGKKRFLNAMNNSVSLNAHMGEELQICDYIFMPGVRKGRNGAPDVECQNTILISTENVAYFTQSDGVARSMDAIVFCYEDDFKSDSDFFIPLTCVSQELANGNTVKAMVITD